MAETYKILGQIAPTDNKEYVLYTSPSGTETLVTNITATNRSGSEKTVDINYYDSVVVENDLADFLAGSSGFVAILGSEGTGSNLGFSTDGITWTSTAVGQQTNWDRIAFGDGKYVAVDSEGNQFAYSTNGTTWTTDYFPQELAGGYPSQIVYGNGIFSVIINNPAFGGSWPIYSTDGTTWTRSSVNGSTQGTLLVVEYQPQYFNLAYGNGLFVTTTNNPFGAAYATSTDGISWTQSEQGGYIGQGQISLDDFAYINNQFVGVSSNNSQVIYSSNGTSWSTTNAPQGEGVMSIAYAFSYYWLGLGSSLYKASALADIGTSWTFVQLSEGAIFGDTESAYNDGVLAIGSTYSTNMLYTSDGTTWITASLPNQHGTVDLNERGGLSLSTYASPASKAIYKNLSIAANDFEVLEPGIVMAPQTTVVVKGNSDTTISVYGVELS